MPRYYYVLGFLLMLLMMLGALSCAILGPCGAACLHIISLMVSLQRVSAASSSMPQRLVSTAQHSRSWPSSTSMARLSSVMVRLPAFTPPFTRLLDSESHLCGKTRHFLSARFADHLQQYKQHLRHRQHAISTGQQSQPGSKLYNSMQQRSMADLVMVPLQQSSAAHDCQPNHWEAAS